MQKKKKVSKCQCQAIDELAGMNAGSFSSPPPIGLCHFCGEWMGTVRISVTDSIKCNMSSITFSLTIGVLLPFLLSSTEHK